jgi:spermidine synthase
LTSIPSLSRTAKSGQILLSVFLVSTCGLIYELVAGTISSYLLGDSVTQFSLVIGFFLSFMGVGAFLSQYVERNLMARFISVQFWTGLLGGLSGLILFAAFAFTASYTLLLLMVVALLGTLVGLEIPLLVRIVKETQELKVTLSNVLALDYIGALVASILFPLLLLPHLGLVQTPLLFGLVNLIVGVGLIRWAEAGTRQKLKPLFVAGLLCLSGTFLFADRLTKGLEHHLYDDEVIFTKSTPYQRLVLTRWREDVRLYINGALQFSALDEYRYHESLVHPAMSVAATPRRVLVLGGGDGLAVREVLKHGSVERIDLVDIDPDMTGLFKTRPLLTALNHGALNDPKVRVINADAMNFLTESRDFYDVVIMDFPDPNVPAVGKLYSRSFFQLALRRISARGVLTTQATSPFFAKQAYWSIVSTLEKAVFGKPEQRIVTPYHVNVPSFGEWGFVLATPGPFQIEKVTVPVKTRFLNSETLPGLFAFSKDLQRVDVEKNELSNQSLIRYYAKAWKKWNY